jgi:hypothetical protein
MAILQKRNVSLADVTGLPIAGEAVLTVLTRLRELHFPYPSNANISLVFEPFLNGAGGKKEEDITIELKSEPQEPQPPADVLDPLSGEVLVPAASEWPRIPSISEMRQMPLPEGPRTIATFGDLFDVARRQLYLAMIALMPQWQDATEG